MIARTTLALLLGLAVAGGAQAAGSSSSSSRSSPDQDYRQALSKVRGADYQGAVRLLERVVGADASNADAWNYLGFARRKLGRYSGAQAAYDRALAIDPGHRGAHEYLGELYLMQGKLGEARQMLVRLARLCPSGCPERDELAEAIAKQ